MLKALLSVFAASPATPCFSDPRAPDMPRTPVHQWPHTAFSAPALLEHPDPRSPTLGLARTPISSPAASRDAGRLNVGFGRRLNFPSELDPRSPSASVARSPLPSRIGGASVPSPVAFSEKEDAQPCSPPSLVVADCPVDVEQQETRPGDVCDSLLQWAEATTVLREVPAPTETAHVHAAQTAKDEGLDWTENKENLTTAPAPADVATELDKLRGEFYQMRLKDDYREPARLCVSSPALWRTKVASSPAGIKTPEGYQRLLPASPSSRSQRALFRHESDLAQAV